MSKTYQSKPFVSAVALAVLCFFSLLPLTAAAYLDPTTGSMLISAIVGLFASLVLAVKTYWYRIKGFFSRKPADPRVDDGTARDVQSFQAWLDEHGLWQEPLSEVGRKAAGLRVRELMYTPGANEYIDAEAPISQGMHLLAAGRRLSLIVNQEGVAVGVLRLTDLFSEISQNIKEGPA